MIKALKNQLGLNDRDLTVLQAHLSVLPKDLRKDSPKWSYKSVKALLERANGMDDSTFNRSEKRLEKAGLLRRNLSANGRRFPVFHPESREIVGAYGVDLQPLFDQLDTFGALAARVEEERVARINLVTSISSWLANIRRALTERLGDVPEAFLELAGRMRRLTRRKMISIPELEDLRDDVREVESRYLGDMEEAPDRQAPCPTVSVSAEEFLGDVHQNEWHIESEQKDSKTMTQVTRPVVTYETLDDVWNACDSISDVFPEKPRSGNELGKLLFQFANFIGLHERITIRALETWGPVKTLIAFDYLATRIADILNPEGYLMSMLKSYDAGRAVASGRIKPGPA